MHGFKERRRAGRRGPDVASSAVGSNFFLFSSRRASRNHAIPPPPTERPDRCFSAPGCRPPGRASCSGSRRRWRGPEGRRRPRRGGRTRRRVRSIRGTAVPQPAATGVSGWVSGRPLAPDRCGSLPDQTRRRTSGLRHRLAQRSCRSRVASAIDARTGTLPPAFRSRAPGRAPALRRTRRALVGASHAALGGPGCARGPETAKPASEPLRGSRGRVPTPSPRCKRPVPDPSLACGCARSR
jgi:hypothetical protein